MKRFVFSLAMFILVFCLAAFPAAADDFAQLEFVDTGDSITISACDAGYEGTLSIPAEINGKAVTSIGSGAFTGCEYIEK